jgi:UrcA family protein
MEEPMKALLITAGLLAMAGSPALAQQETTVYGPPRHSERVPYHMIELASPIGIADVKSRLRAAAHRVCAPDEDTFRTGYSEVGCYRPTIVDAFAKLDRAIDLTSGGASLSATILVVRAR